MLKLLTSVSVIMLHVHQRFFCLNFLLSDVGISFDQNLAFLQKKLTFLVGEGVILPVPYEINSLNLERTDK